MATEQKGDLLIRDLCHNGTDSVCDIRVMNTTANSHLAKTMEKFLHEAERAKKKMYLETCLQQRRKFSPFIASVGGLIIVEATATLKRISSRLETKWRQPYYRTCRYVNIRITITLVRAKNRCIQWFRVTAHNISVQRLQWEDGAGLNLFR